VDASKVKCYGTGVEAKEVTAGQPVSFTVDTTEAGEAPLQVTYTDQSGKNTAMTITMTMTVRVE
jgi:filamin